MWTITSVTSETAKSYVLFGGPQGQEVVGPTDPLGPANSTYILAFPGLGYMKLKDMGNTVPGGDWSVSASGAPTNWFYGGGGQARINVKANGDFTITGGSKDANGKLIPF